MFSPAPDDVCMIMKFLSNSPICHITANTFPQLPMPSVVTLTANQHFAVNRWNSNYSGTTTGPGGAKTGAAGGGTSAGAGGAAGQSSGSAASAGQSGSGTQTKSSAAKSGSDSQGIFSFF